MELLVRKGMNSNVLFERLIDQGQARPADTETLERVSLETPHAPTMPTAVDRELDASAFLDHVDTVKGPEGEQYVVLSADDTRAADRFKRLPSVDGFVAPVEVFPEGHPAIPPDAQLLLWTDRILVEIAHLYSD